MTPSPTMPTLWPAAWSSFTLSALSPGRTSASTMSIPSSPAIRRAVPRLSPVIMATLTPRACSRRMVAAAVGRTASATAIRPMTRPSRAIWTTVRPAPCSRSDSVASSPSSTPLSAMSMRLPERTVRPATVARSPLPPKDSKPAAASSGRSFVRSSTALAMWCSDPRSRAAAVVSRSVSSTPAAGVTWTTFGAPRVRVPVLSKTMTSSLTACSRAAAFLISTPWRAPSPVPTMIAMGVARPRASGQAMTKTVMVRVRANSRVWPRAQNQTPKVSRPMTTAASTSHWEARSASNWAGALEFCASCTSLTICARAVSAPTRVAR
ncbi:hypothetical protein D3C77_404090 [compost metagenome]